MDLPAWASPIDVQGPYARYSIIKDQGLQVVSAVTLAERKNQRCATLPDLSTVNLAMGDRLADLLEILRQNVTHHFCRPYAHAGIAVHQGRFQDGNGLWHLYESERFDGPDADRCRLVVGQNPG